MPPWELTSVRAKPSHFVKQAARPRAVHAVSFGSEDCESIVFIFGSLPDCEEGD